MKHPIEFQVHTPGKLELIPPLQPSNHIPFQDLLLTPEYSRMKYTLPKGTSTFRLLPAIKGSDFWMATIDAIDQGNGRHVHPKTFQPSEDKDSVFDTAKAWLKKHQPSMLYSKAEPTGHKFWIQKVAAFWILIDGPEPPELRILLASEFPGSRQVAKPGLGHKLKELVQNKPELLDPDAGYQLKVTRAYSAGSKYPETQITVHQTSTSLNEALGELSAEDLARVRPIMDTIRQTDTEQEWALLAKVIGDELANTIRTESADI
ncbi:MAG: hypothetical protein Q8Q59_09295 [Luteolibacter sp.]|jgi:hypothetical protein|nr:hypothetical protein [Luteolibacter sp.]